MGADLLSAQEAAATADQSRALLATQIGELQAQLADAEAASGRGLKQEVRKLELRILELESDVDSAGRQSLTVAKQARQAEKRAGELEAALDEEKKASAAASADGAKLVATIKTLRLSLEEAQMKNNSLATK